MNIRQYKRRGFTLLEILTVVGIILILVGLLLPAVHRLMVQAKKKKIATDIMTLGTAIRGYNSEYKKWPCPEDDLGLPDRTYGGSAMKDNYKIFNILSNAVPPLLNVSVFKVDNMGNIVDPWGIPYQIVLDTDYTAAGNATVVITSPNM